MLTAPLAYFSALWDFSLWAVSLSVCLSTRIREAGWLRPVPQAVRRPRGRLGFILFLLWIILECDSKAITKWKGTLTSNPASSTHAPLPPRGNFPPCFLFIHPVFLFAKISRYLFAFGPPSYARRKRSLCVALHLGLVVFPLNNNTRRSFHTGYIQVCTVLSWEACAIVNSGIRGFEP